MSTDNSSNQFLFLVKMWQHEMSVDDTISWDDTFFVPNEITHAPAIHPYTLFVYAFCLL